MPDMGHSDSWWRYYHRLREQGYTREKAARIANTVARKNRKKGRRRRG